MLCSSICANQTCLSIGFTTDLKVKVKKVLLDDCFFELLADLIKDDD